MALLLSAKLEFLSPRTRLSPYAPSCKCAIIKRAMSVAVALIAPSGGVVQKRKGLRCCCPSA